MTFSPEKQVIQAFRSSSSDKIIHILAKLDPKKGHHIVLWRDIQRAFEGARFIMDGASYVPFILDENFDELMPQRIPYHPGIVLEVVVAGNNHTDNTTQLAKLTEATPMEEKEESKDQDNNLYSQALTEDTMVDLSSTTQDLVTLSITELYADDQPLVKYSSGQPDDTKLSLHANNQMYNSYLQTIITGQETQAIGIKRSMDQHFDRLQQEIEKGRALQEQLAQMQQQMQDLQQQMRHGLLEKQTQMEQKQERVLQLQHQLQQEQEKAQEDITRKQNEMLDLQKQTLSGLMRIMSRVQALLTQTYELHEYPVPRLFIVLPKSTGSGGKISGLFMEQLRLYFLCECGTHTMPEGCDTPHEVHLAKHEGYELDKPKEFFEKYGTYILAMMCMIKYGVIAAGVVVPPLANFKIVEGLETNQKNFDYLKKNITSLVDDTISFLQDIKSKGEMGEGLAAGHSEFDKLKALEGADLRQLESYLKIRDEGRILGNLYRIVTPEGHVKWVCFDHYRANYRESAIKRLEEFVVDNHGTFMKERGRIKIGLISHVVAKHFYEVMVNARGVQELEVTLKWDANMDELRTFAKAVTSANVIRLTINGAFFKRPALDIVNRGRRFNPIMQLASNARIQSLQLKSFDDFFARISKSSLGPSPKLRVLSVESEVPSQDKSKSLDNLLEYYSSLTTLEVKLQGSTTRTVSDVLIKLPKIELLKIDGGDLFVTAGVSDGTILDVNIIIKSLDELGSNDYKFILENRLTKLAIKFTPREADDLQLTNILRQCPLLSHLQVGCEGKRSLDLINLVLEERKWTLDGTGASSLHKFELMDEDLVPFDKLANRDKSTHVQSHITFHDGSNSFDMCSWIRLRDRGSSGGDPVDDFLCRYGWTSVFFDGFFLTGNVSTAVLKTPPMEKPRLESLWIHCEETSNITEFVESPCFKDLGLYVDISHNFEQGRELLLRYGPVLSKLHLYRSNNFVIGGLWTRLLTFIPTRISLPVMESFELQPNFDFPHEFVQWIVAMVSSPPENSAPREQWTSLRKIVLCQVNLDSKDWKAVIEAIDLSALERLDFRDSNITQEQIELLVNRISGHPSHSLPLATLDVEGTKFAETITPQALEGLTMEIRMKAALITVNKD
ncbi:MAG: hypothetical protein J3Q66DRAFT_438038 [Benniella sp.]|nr:MAG: hypothetical protein J3Q66DRAFT_438038 [Benniella sp.]